LVNPKLVLSYGGARKPRAYWPNTACAPSSRTTAPSLGVIAKSLIGRTSSPPLARLEAASGCGVRLKWLSRTAGVSSSRPMVISSCT
jgi:hypothetical protein